MHRKLWHSMKVQINEENNINQSETLNFSEDKLTEKQHLICPLLFTETVKEK